MITQVMQQSHCWNTFDIRKIELGKSVDLSLCGLAPAQSQMDLFLDTLCAREKQRAVKFNQSEEAMSRVTASAMFFART